MSKASEARGLEQFVRARLQIPTQPGKFVKARFQMFKQPLKIVIPSEAEGRFSSGHGFSRAENSREETGFSR
jgi:hypothetical protein